MILKTTACTLALLAAAATALAENVDLVTLPRRAAVQLTIYNSEDLTLVKETRLVTLKQGPNRLQFSWAGTLIDPTSVTFRAVDHADEVELADTVFPGQKPQHLIWNIESAYEGQVLVEVTYFTSGLTWSMDYVAIVDPAEQAMQFRGYVRVFNNSGEDYENAEVRLIVGTINLVEKIADLARRRGLRTEDLGRDETRRLNRAVMSEAIDRAGLAMDPPPPPAAGMPARPRAIVKEGLSEYFMFSVEGTETVPNGWSKRMRAVKADDVTFDILYRMRDYQYGPRPVRFFLWRNDAEHALGDSPLPDGLVRVFRDNGQDGLACLGEQRINYVPIKAEIEVNLGSDDLVVYETVNSSTERLNFSFRRERNGREWVEGWDEKTRWIDTVRNYRTRPIRFELRRAWDGDIDYTSEIATTLFDYRTIEATFDVPAGASVPYPATVVTHQGTNARQARVNLK